MMNKEYYILFIWSLIGNSIRLEFDDPADLMNTMMSLCDDGYDGAMTIELFDQSGLTLVEVD